MTTFASIRLTELMMRFEQPNPKQRWDDPCYLIRPGDVLPVQEMAALLASAKPDSATYATQYSKVSDTNYLFDIEKVSQEAISAILEASNQSMIGDAIAIPNATKKVNLMKTVNMAELRRLRRQYLTLTRQMANTQSGYTQQTLTNALNDFIDYINAQLSS
jgi:protein KTI12